MTKKLTLMPPEEKLETMTREERSLLLYLECRVVDYGGLVDQIRMNNEDRAIADRWNEEGLIQYGRLKFREIEEYQSDNRPGVKRVTHYCIFSNEAFELAHGERRARHKRMRARYADKYTFAAENWRE